MGYVIIKIEMTPKVVMVMINILGFILFVGVIVAYILYCLYGDGMSPDDF